jgi:elongation factor 1-gamma
LDFSANELEPVLSQLIFPVFGLISFDLPLCKRAQNDASALLKVLDERLKLNTYLVGKQLSIADVAVASALWYPMRFLFDQKFRTPFANLARWFDSIVSLSEWKQVWGQLRLCVKPLEAAKVEKVVAKE